MRGKNLSDEGLFTNAFINVSVYKLSFFRDTCIFEKCRRGTTRKVGTRKLKV